MITDASKRSEIFMDIFGKKGLLKTCSNEEEFDKNAMEFLEKHGESFQRHYKYIPAFLARLLLNVLHPGACYVNYFNFIQFVI